LRGVWTSTTPRFARHWNDRRTKEEIKEVAKAERWLWSRHDPKKAFEASRRTGGLIPKLDLNCFDEAVEDPDYVLSFCTDLWIHISDYLSRPELQHPVLDWIFLDMTISWEVSTFAKAIENNWGLLQEDMAFRLYRWVVRLLFRLAGRGDLLLKVITL